MKQALSQQAASVAQAWKQHWDQSDMRPDSSPRGRLLRRYIALFGGLSASRYILRRFLEASGSIDGLKILDAGAGTGLNSLPLARKGARITLLDIAPQALAIAKSYYREQSLQAEYVEGSIFGMPFPDGAFDIVWNTGVIEHFEPELRKKAVHEMLRVLKPNGLLITFNPNAQARIYRYAKRTGEAKGTWDVGFELPIETLRADIDENAFVLAETEEGWFMQLHFLKYCLPRALRLPFVMLHELVQSAVPFLNRQPGYLRVSVIRSRKRGS